MSRKNKNRVHVQTKLLFTNLKRQLAFGLLPIVILTLVITTLLRWFVPVISNDQVSVLLDATMQNVESAIDNLEHVNLVFSENAIISLSMFKALNGDRLDFANARSLDIVKQFFNSHINTREFVTSSYYYRPNENRRFLSSLDDFKLIDTFYDQGWFESYQNCDENVWYELRAIDRMGVKQDVVSLYYRQPNNAILIYNISTKYFLDRFSKLNMYKDQLLLVIGKKGEVLFKNKQTDYIDSGDLRKLLNTENAASSIRVAIQGKEYILQEKDFGRFNWKFVSLIPSSQIFKDFKPIQTASYLACAISFLICVLAAYRIAKRQSDNINHIVNMFDDLQSECDQRSYTTNRQLVSKEYESIVENIVRLFVEREYMTLQADAQRYKLQTTELIALQAQMNPHLLFNTLEMVNWEAISMLSYPNKISNMIGDLSKILRVALTDPMDMITVAEEIENTKCYVRIQQERHGGLEVEWEVEEEVLDQRVMKMILQPLIENSLIHGFKDRSEGNHIRICVYTLGARMFLTVEDNGTGVNPKELEQLIQKIHNEKDTHTFDHIGLCNLYKRITLRFGEQADVKVASTQGKGTCITVVIPTSQRE